MIGSLDCKMLKLAQLIRPLPCLTDLQFADAFHRLATAMEMPWRCYVVVFATTQWVTHHPTQRVSAISLYKRDEHLTLAIELYFQYGCENKDPPHMRGVCVPVWVGGGCKKNLTDVCLCHCVTTGSVLISTDSTYIHYVLQKKKTWESYVPSMLGLVVVLSQW